MKKWDENSEVDFKESIHLEDIVPNKYEVKEKRNEGH
jgi:hypothetical protein